MQRLNEAVRMAVAGYPDGLVGLCRDLCLNYETTRKEIAGEHGFKLDATKALEISIACIRKGGENCRAVKDAIDAAHEEAGEPPAALSMSERIAKAAQEFADVIAAEAAARADGVYSPNERKRIHKQVLEAIGALILIDQGAEQGASHLRSVGR